MRTAVILFAAVLLVGCASSETEPPRIPIGSAVCAVCGMEVKDVRYAAALRKPDQDQYFDAIECLIRRLRQDPSGEAWLTDYDPPHTLLPAASVIVARADFPSPMGGGYAAFSDRVRARTVAEAMDGVAESLTFFVEGGGS